LRLISIFFLLLFSSYIARAQCEPVPNKPGTLSCISESALVDGGSGKHWGKWFEITSAPVPDGYEILSVSFRLEGPHPCTADLTYTRGQAERMGDGSAYSEILNSVTGVVGPTRHFEPGPSAKGIGSWAQCEQIKWAKSSVTWRFQFQGWSAETRKITIEKNSDSDPSCKQPNKSPEKEEYCNQTSPHVGWTSKDEPIHQKAKLYTIAVGPAPKN